MKLSTIFTLNVQDWIKGLIMAIGGAVFAVIQSSIAAGIFTIDWQNIWHIALGAFVVYIGKNFFTPAPKTVEVNKSVTQVIDITPDPPQKPDPTGTLGGDK